MAPMGARLRGEAGRRLGRPDATARSRALAKRVPRAPPGAGAARVRSPVSWEAASDDAEAAPEGTDPEAGPARFSGPQGAGRVRQQVERVQLGRVEIVYAVIAGADLEPVNDGACSARALDRAPQPSPEAEGAARVGIRCEYSEFLWPEPADGVRGAAGLLQALGDSGDGGVAYASRDVVRLPAPQVGGEHHAGERGAAADGPGGEVPHAPRQAQVVVEPRCPVHEPLLAGAIR